MHSKGIFPRHPRKVANPAAALAGLLILLFLSVLLSGCRSAGEEPTRLTLPVSVDGRQVTISAKAGDSVEQALADNGISLGELDRTLPSRETLLNASIDIRVTRVEHVLETRQEEIPFETNILPNETMALGEQQVLQDGINGLEEITYQHVIEDGIEVTTVISSRTILREPQNEILMEGVSAPNVPVALNGRLAYLTAGNA